MITIVRGIYRDNVIYPLDPVPLGDNTPVIFEIDMNPTELVENNEVQKVYQIKVTPVLSQPSALDTLNK